MKYIVLFLCLITVMLGQVVAASEPPDLRISKVTISAPLTITNTKGVKVTFNPGDERLIDFVRLKNDSKTKKGALLLGVGDSLFRFHLGRKIELDSFRLPYWLVAISAGGEITGQRVSLSIKKEIEGVKAERDLLIRETCSEQLSRLVCHIENVSPPGSPPYYVERCFNEYRTFYGDREVEVRRTEGVDQYQASWFQERKSILDMMIDIPKISDRVLYYGRCRLPYVGPEWH